MGAANRIEPAADRAVFLSLTGEGVPAAVEEPFRSAGFHCESEEWESFVELPAESGAVHLFWTGGDWQGGFERLENLSEEKRCTAVLVGERKEDQEIIPSVLRLGILAAIAVPVPEWFLPPLAAAAGRAGKSYQRLLAQAVDDLQQDLEQTPESLLARTAQAAGQLLGADLALVALKSQESERFEVLTRTARGELRTEPWGADTDRRRAPTGLATFVFETMEVTIVPSVEHSHLCQPGEGPGRYEAAVLQPIRIEGPGIDPLVACINLFWRRPYLPIPNEILALEILAALARSSLARLVEQERLAAIHSKARDVIADAMGGVAHEFLTHDPRQFPTTERVDAAAADALSRFAKLMAEAYANRPGLRELWIRLPHPWVGQSQKRWLCFGTHAAGDEPPPRTSEVDNKIDVVEVLNSDGGWAVQTRLVSGKPHLGELVAIFASRASAWAARTEIRRLVDDLYTAARQQRRAADTAALLRLSTVPAEPEAARDDLREIVEMVRVHTGSDGAKVYVMLRDAEGPKIWLLCTTDFPDVAPNPLHLRAKRGLQDWVLAHQDWLLIPEMSGETGKKLESGITGRFGFVEVMGRPEKEHLPDLQVPDPDSEDTMLFVPLSTRGRTTGVLAIWRDRRADRSGVPYDEESDTESLLNFAPHVAATCQRMLQVLKAQKELAAISVLARHLSSAESLSQAYDAIAEGVVQLADAAVAVVLHYDQESWCELYLSAFWCAHAAAAAGVSQALSRFHVVCGPDPDAWPERVVADLEPRLTDFTFRGLLTPTTAKGEPAPLTVALFDPARAENEPVFFSDDLLEHFAHSFLQAACAMLEGYASELASRLIDQIGGSESWAKASAEDVLHHATELLVQATGADAALIYTGTPQHMSVRSVRPQVEELLDLRVSSDSFTQKSLRQAEPVRVLDVGKHGHKMSHKNLERLAEAFGWDEVGSWLCCAVAHDGRSIGLIKLLTRPDGVFFGKDHERMTHIIAQRTATEMYKANSREQLQDLLQIGDELTNFKGKALEREMASRFSHWIHKTLLRPECEVAIVAHVPREKVRLVLEGSAGVSSATLLRLEEISLRWEAEKKNGTITLFSKTVPDVVVLNHPTGVAVSIELPGEARLAGHLYVLDRESFYLDDIEAIRRAAHYMALVINSERERRNWRQVMGRFRHAVLGPVQGLTSAAKMLVVHAEKGNVRVVGNVRFEDLRDQIVEESSIIRLWRKNQRFYLIDEPEAQRRKQALKPIVERCITRYTPIAARRDISLKLDWRPKGDLHVWSDPDAIDLALSNLLDNACKYSFFHKFITVGVLADRSFVRLWVENVGHKIPSHIGAEIYTFGKRGVRQDPLRVITGQGIGLNMVMAVVEAHEGELFHSCEQFGRGRHEDTTPYKIRFTIDLPWSVKK